MEHGDRKCLFVFLYSTCVCIQRVYVYGYRKCLSCVYNGVDLSIYTVYENGMYSVCLRLALCHSSASVMPRLSSDGTRRPFLSVCMLWFCVVLCVFLSPLHFMCCVCDFMSSRLLCVKRRGDGFCFWHIFFLFGSVNWKRPLSNTRAEWYLCWLLKIIFGLAGAMAPSLYMRQMYVFIYARAYICMIIMSP